jgi:predicted DNA-binding protein with PD1-like motif
MQYTEGRMGRVFSLRIDDGEDVLEELTRFVREKGIVCGMVQVLGALREGSIVTGPERPVFPPVPHREMIAGGWEVVGTGTVYPGEGGPALHLHVAAGRGEATRAGCLRERAEVYLVVEAVVVEFTGMAAERAPDARTGVHLPVFGGG